MAFDREPPEVRSASAAPRSADEVRRLVDDASRVLHHELSDIDGALVGGASVEALQACVDGALDRCLVRLASTGLVGRDNQTASRDFWRAAALYLERGGLQNRARTKPRGYAGDFEMQADFYEQRVVADPLGRLFDRYFLKQQAVDAVRARMEEAGEAIAERCRTAKKSRFHVASVGSGPGIDLERAARALTRDERLSLQFVLVDIDEAALTAAGDRLRGLLAGQQVAAHRENLYRLAKGKRGADILQEADVIVCPGLFDYLGDADAVAMLRLYWDSLAAGGVFFVGNFAPHCSTRPYMEWIGNWYLIYRSADDLRLLAEAAQIPAESFRVGTERTGCDLFLIAEKR